MISTVFDIEAHRAKRNRQLERENEVLRDERLRLERLLGLAVRTAVAATGVREGAFLEALCLVARTDPAKAAFLERRERSIAEARLAGVLKVLRETA